MALLRRPGRRARSALGLLALAQVLPLAPVWPREGSSTRIEYDVKAAFLYNFAKFVEWPSDGRHDSGGSLVIGVLGKDPFGDALERTIKGKVVSGRALVLKRFDSAKEVAGTQILFVSQSESAGLAQMLRAISDKPILTVGETVEFTRFGGVIGFFMESNRVRFEVNLDAAEAAGLKISSKLLSVARVVEGNERKVP